MTMERSVACQIHGCRHEEYCGEHGCWNLNRASLAARILHPSNRGLITQHELDLARSVEALQRRVAEKERLLVETEIEATLAGDRAEQAEAQVAQMRAALESLTDAIFEQMRTNGGISIFVRVKAQDARKAIATPPSPSTRKFIYCEECGLNVSYMTAEDEAPSSPSDKETRDDL